MAPFLQVHKDGVLLSIRLQPRASRDEIAGVLGSDLKIKVTAPPVDSAANEALLRLLADVLDCPRQSIQLLRGHSSRQKKILILGLSADEIEKRLPQQA